MREFSFVQEVKINGLVALNEHIFSLAYIETGDISGVKLILTLMDETALYRDNYGLKKDAELIVTLGDDDGRGNNHWIETFIAKKVSVAGGLLVAECFQKDCDNIKKLESEPIFYVDMQPAAILKDIFPNLIINADSFPKAGTYHINSGSTKSWLIRTMARDYGAMCFVARGVVHFKSIKSLANLPSSYTMEVGNPSATTTIARYSILGEEDLYTRVRDRQFMTWDTQAGLMTGKKNPDKPISMISCMAADNLDAQNVHILPILEAEMFGNGGFTPALACTVQIHKVTPDSEIDESIPARMYISQVTHFQQAQRYNCKALLGVIHE